VCENAITWRGRISYSVNIAGTLDVLRVEWTQCSRKGRYTVRKLIEQHGHNTSMMAWKEQLAGDCPKRDAPQPHDRSDPICPNLPQVV
jgi:hypothetical protein